MIKLSMDLTAETTWGELKRWVDAVESIGEVQDSAVIIRDLEGHGIERDRLEVEVN